MKRSLDLLKEHQRTLSVGSPGRRSPPGGRKYTQGADGTPTSSGSGVKHQRMAKIINSSLNRRISNVTHRIEAATRRSIGTPNHGIEESLGEPEVEAFCLSVSALQQLMASERVLMIGIVPHQYQRKIFEIITAKVSKLSSVKVPKSSSAESKKLSLQTTFWRGSQFFRLFATWCHFVPPWIVQWKDVNPRFEANTRTWSTSSLQLDRWSWTVLSTGFEPTPQLRRRCHEMERSSS